MENDKVENKITLKRIALGIIGEIITFILKGILGWWG